jgi:hypothetical protein
MGFLSIGYFHFNTRPCIHPFVPVIIKSVNSRLVLNISLDRLSAGSEIWVECVFTAAMGISATQTALQHRAPRPINPLFQVHVYISTTMKDAKYHPSQNLLDVTGPFKGLEFG